MRPSRRPPMPPPVAIVVPARNEADNIAQSVTSLLRQDYPALSLIVVDDDSDDGTADVARARRGVARRASRSSPSCESHTLPPRLDRQALGGEAGRSQAAEEKFAPKYLMLTDADIVHAPDTLSWLVAQAEAHSLVLASLTARWRCENLAERVHIPAFIYLLPDALSVRLGEPAGSRHGGRGRRLHAGARRRAARRRRHRDHPRRADRRLRARARNSRSRARSGSASPTACASIRPYASWGDIRRMVARSAYAQLQLFAAAARRHGRSAWR